jgi:hypothetical protein
VIGIGRAWLGRCRYLQRTTLDAPKSELAKHDVLLIAKRTDGAQTKRMQHGRSTIDRHQARKLAAPA